MPKTQNKAPTPDQAALILYGLDNAQHPRAGWFGEKAIPAATKAAAQLGFHAWKVSAPVPNELGQALLKGSVAASGYSIIDKIKPAVYNQLVKFVVMSNGAKQFIPTITDAEKALTKPFTATDIAECERQLYATAHEKSLGRLPNSWTEIKAGSFVLSQFASDDAWYECIVQQRVGDMLVVRWRDYPKYPPALRHCATVALLNSNQK